MTTKIVTIQLPKLVVRFELRQTMTTDGAKCFYNFEFEIYFYTNLGVKHSTEVSFYSASNDCALSGV